MTTVSAPGTGRARAGAGARATPTALWPRLRISAQSMSPRTTGARTDAMKTKNAEATGGAPSLAGARAKTIATILPQRRARSQPRNQTTRLRPIPAKSTRDKAHLDLTSARMTTSARATEPAPFTDGAAESTNAPLRLTNAQSTRGPTSKALTNAGAPMNARATGGAPTGAGASAMITVHRTTTTTITVAQTTIRDAARKILSQGHEQQENQLSVLHSALEDNHNFIQLSLLCTTCSLKQKFKRNLQYFVPFQTFFFQKIHKSI